jgi:gamma-glutamylcyclotransferase (GGCT)/AIG2-like uncharacterized protein YtfP
MELPLFIYGTLHPERAPASIAPTARLLRSLGRATIHGRLYDFGEYPGVVLTSNPSEVVRGELFRLPEDQAAAALARLDEYEDYRPSDPETSLFLRERVEATMEDGSRIACWVYTCNRA